MALNDTWIKHHRGDLDHTSHRAFHADNLRNCVNRHAVLHTDYQGAWGEVRLNQLNGPSRVIGLDED